MPKRRDQIRMSDEEFWQFVESQKTVQVATVQRDGSPHLMPLWFAVEDGAIVLETFSKSQKVKNLERDPRITLLFEDGDEYNALRGASIGTRAELVQDDIERIHALHMAVLLRNTPDIPRDVLEQASRSMAPKKTAILVRPEKIVSWDHSKLEGIY
ncbi:MAG: pyridoxamine 5'-phosphate oxidase family protein [Myxococcota bacterium]|nr:pyridoxamine 5'-phosphate oxidase family protein [Myxococcota bacterium]